MADLVVYTDGGSRGNPGPAGIGAVIEENGGRILHKISEYIGEATNNQAEYQALIKALEWIKNNYDTAAKIECRLDSELVVKQLKGEYKIKNEGLKPLFSKVNNLIDDLGAEVRFSHILRDKNERADELVNIALDNYLEKNRKRSDVDSN